MTAPTDIDREANEFAMELLMPADWLIADIKKMGGVDPENYADVQKLARRYGVTDTLMAIRIGQLMVRT